jgi:hypothetical protein
MMTDRLRTMDDDEADGKTPGAASVPGGAAARRWSPRRVRTAWRAWSWRWRAEPDFLVVGAQKAGTTSLHNVLARHPQLVACARKEPQYFAYNHRRGERWYRSLFPLRAAIRRPWRRPSRPLVFESSTYYLNHPLAPARVAERLPRAKIVVLLRNPIDRAHSQHGHEVAAGRESRTFADAVAGEVAALAGEEERIANGDDRPLAPYETKGYVERSRYGPQLERWFARFPPEQILVLRSEDLFGLDSMESLGRAYDFLGVARRSTPLGRDNAGRPVQLDPSLRARLRPLFVDSNELVARFTGIRWPEDWP